MLRGGVWEHMSRTIRKVLYALLSSSPRMTDDVLHTVLVEVENIVNSRPLTKCSDDVTDDTALTPNHLLMMSDNCPLPWGVTCDADTYRRRWRHAQTRTFFKFW